MLPNNAEPVSVTVPNVRGAMGIAVPCKGNGELNVSGQANGLYLVCRNDGPTSFAQRFTKK
ncbi:hypothetical protein GCM10022409_09450 [Hymenobacter glaciei]|uniref:Uncharacterized protein n=1 Tax=Hymenobacter glaciei TaxID=877209 RepID=A0ABP7TK82_9BACT